MKALILALVFFSFASAQASTTDRLDQTAQIMNWIETVAEAYHPYTSDMPEPRNVTQKTICFESQAEFFAGVEAHRNHFSIAAGVSEHEKLKASVQGRIDRAETFKRQLDNLSSQHQIAMDTLAELFLGRMGSLDPDEVQAWCNNL